MLINIKIMERYIDRIYSTKKYIDNEYESVGEMYKNKYHKKEPYIFTISASNSAGNSVTSDATSDVVPYTVPSSPVITDVKPVNANPPRSRFDAGDVRLKVGETISVNFNLLTGTDVGKTGDTINYKVSAVPSNNPSITPITSTGTTSPIMVGGLTNGTEYIFTMTSTNSVGSSLTSNSLNGIPKGRPKKATIKTIMIANDWNSFIIKAEIPKLDSSTYDVNGTGTTKYTPYIYDDLIGSVFYYPQSSFTLNGNNPNVTLTNTNTDIVTAEIRCVSVSTDPGEINRELKKIFNGRSGFYIKTENDFCWMDDYILDTNNNINWIYLGKPGKPTITSTIDNKNGSATITFTGSDNGKFGEAGLQVFNNLKYTIKTTLSSGSSLPSGSTLPPDIVTSSTNPITVSGLVSGVNYTFTLYSTNSYIDTANNINKTVNSDSVTSSLSLIINPPDKITDLIASPGTKKIELKFKKPSSSIQINSYKIISYYTKTINNAISTYKETIEVPVPATGTSANYSIDTSNNVTITLYTKSNNATFTLDTSVNGTTDTEKRTNQINSAIQSTTNTLNLLESQIQPYERVPLLSYPIGKEREGYYNDIKNKKCVKRDNKMKSIYNIIFLIFIVFFLININNKKN
jgi:hypothetical protein